MSAPLVVDRQQGSPVKSQKTETADEAITFTWADVQGVQYPYDDPLVVAMNIANYNTNRVLVDNGSYVDVLFYNALLKMNILPIQLKGTCRPLTGISRETVSIKGTVALPMIAGQVP